MREAGRRRALTLTCAVLALLTACDPAPAPVQLVGTAMGTTYSVNIPRLPAGSPPEAIEAVIRDTLRDADDHLSGWNPRSELVRFNAARSTDWRAVSPVLVEVAQLAHRICVDSGGAFDPTVAPLVRAWGFGAGVDGDAPAPGDDVILRLRAQVGCGRLDVRASPPGLRKQVASLSVDLDGIAPGWAVDRIAERFEALGIADYLVELGGEVRARGRNPAGRAWRVAVERPRAGERVAHAVIELDGVAVSTSGDYRDYRELDGRRISHTIDPRSGVPVTHGLASVTVVHSSTAAADAWATALMVLGPVDGLALARREQLAALFIERDARGGGWVSAETPAFGRLRVAPDAGL